MRSRVSVYGLAAAGLSVFFVWACLFMSGDVFNFDSDHSCKAFFARYFFSLLPLPGIDAISPPRLVDSALHDLPLMHMPYVGTAFVFLSIPFALVFHLLRVPYSFQIYFAIAGLLAILCVFYSARRLFGDGAAMLTMFFMSVNATFVRSVRTSFVREEVFQVLGLWAGAACLCKAHESGRRGWVYAACFVFGYTLWGKVMFLGYIFGAVFGAVLVPGGRGRALARKIFFPSAKAAAAGLAAFCAGCLPLVYFNISHHFQTLRRILSALDPAQKHLVKHFEAEAPWNNFAVAGNVAERIKDVFAYVSGYIYHDPQTLRFFSFFAALFVCALVWAVFKIARPGRDRKLGDFLVFALGGCSLLTVLSCFIIDSYWHTHILILIPFCELLCALFVADLLRLIRGRTARAMLICFVLSGWGAEQAVRLNAYYAGIRDKEVCLHYRSALAPMLETLDSIGADNLVFPDSIAWGLKLLRPDMEVTIINTEPCLAEFMRRSGRGRLYTIAGADMAGGNQEGFARQGISAGVEKEFTFRDIPELTWFLLRLDLSDDTKARQ